MKQIQKEHTALIIKYTGISFITGWLSHGFFSGERQIITSLLWIALFIIGTLLERSTWEKNYPRIIILSSILAVSIGALTGWLQHFPDSPGRSLWIVPLGFIVSAHAYMLLEKHPLNKKYILYALSWFILFIGISLGFYSLVQSSHISWVWHQHGSTHTKDLSTLITTELPEKQNVVRKNKTSQHNHQH